MGDEHRQKKSITKGMKQVDLAKAIGVSESYMSYLLAGKRTPSLKIAKKLAETTNTKIESWAKGEPQEESFEIEIKLFINGKEVGALTTKQWL